MTLLRRTRPKPIELPIALKEVLSLAQLAELDRQRALRQLSALRAFERDALSSRVRAIVDGFPEHRPVLQHLSSALVEVPNFKKHQQLAETQKYERSSASVEIRKRLAHLASSHPRGSLIGSTQTFGYKSQGEKKHWGTKRKRKG